MLHLDGNDSALLVQWLADLVAVQLCADQNGAQHAELINEDYRCQEQPRNGLCHAQVVVPFWYNGWLVALADVLAGCFVLTSLARQDVKHTSAKLIAV